MTTNRWLRVGAATLIAMAGAVALPAPAHAAMNLTRVYESTESDDSDVKSVTAHCPSGTRVLGGGADVVGASNNAHLIGMQPNGANNTFSAFAKEHHPIDWGWSLTVHAVCAPQPAGLAYVSAVTGGDSSYSHTDYAFCPAGTKVLGVGARVTANDTSKLFLTYVKPTGTGNGAETGAVEMEGGYSGDWTLYSWAICATQPAGWDLVTAVNVGSDWHASFTCPGAKKLTGAGAYISLSLGKLFLLDVMVTEEPGDPSTPKGVGAALSWIDGGYSHDWYFKAYGICVS